MYLKSFLILLIFNIILFYYEIKPYIYMRKLSLYKFLEINIPKRNYSFAIFNPNTWIFNQNVSQYSTKIIYTRNNKLFIEALTLFLYQEENKINYTIKERVKCIVILNQKILSIFAIKETLARPTFGQRSIWKVRCELAPKDYYLSIIKKIRIAITDIQEFNKLNNSDKFINKEMLLSFHIANFYDERVAKKKSVAHCVHTVRGLHKRKTNQLKNWLKIQKNIGIDRVKFYFTSVESSTKMELMQEFVGYIEIVDYRLDFDFICKYSLFLRRSSFNIDTKAIVYLYNNCLNFYRRYFDGTKFDILNANEIICTNDCLLGFKYQYEFTTNYDIDEVIFPRKFYSNDYSYFNSLKDCNQSLSKFYFNYSIYDYTVKLTRKYGSDIGFFYFENVNFLTLPEVSIKAKNFIQSNQGHTKLLLKDNNGLKVSLKMNSSDNSDNKKINEMKAMNEIIECFNRTILNNNNLDSIWNVPYAVLLNHRLGKSIYNSNLTLFYYQHRSEFLEPGAKAFPISIDEGYTVHIRSHFLNIFLNQKYPFSHFRLDIEFYQFVAYLSTIQTTDTPGRYPILT